MLLVTILVTILKMYVAEITKFLVNYFVIRSYIILSLLLFIDSHHFILKKIHKKGFLKIYVSDEF